MVGSFNGHVITSHRCDPLPLTPGLSKNTLEPSFFGPQGRGYGSYLLLQHSIIELQAHSSLCVFVLLKLGVQACLASQLLSANRGHCTLAKLKIKRLLCLSSMAYSCFCSWVSAEVGPSPSLQLKLVCGLHNSCKNSHIIPPKIQCAHCPLFLLV